MIPRLASSRPKYCNTAATTLLAMAKHVGAENLPNAVKSALPRFVAPQLATLVKEPPTGDEWLHELKFDGYRMLCRFDHGDVRSY